MYANKATVAVSPKECFIRFSCFGPEFDVDGNVIATKDIETCEIVMGREMFIKLRDMISEVVGETYNAEEVKNHE